MTLKYYIFSLVLIIFSIPVFCLCIINTMVSLKYETENQGDCISLVTGDNLCLKIQMFLGLLIICIIVLILIFVFKKSIIIKK